MTLAWHQGKLWGEGPGLARSGRWSRHSLRLSSAFGLASKSVILIPDPDLPRVETPRPACQHTPYLLSPSPNSLANSPKGRAGLPQTPPQVTHIAKMRAERRVIEDMEREASRSGGKKCACVDDKLGSHWGVPVDCSSGTGHEDDGKPVALSAMPAGQFVLWNRQLFVVGAAYAADWQQLWLHVICSFVVSSDQTRQTGSKLLVRVATY